jgi:hypothetical protein
MTITIGVPSGHQTAEITAGPGGEGSVIEVGGGQQQAAQAPACRRERQAGVEIAMEAGWPAVADPILAMPPGRPGISRPLHLIAGAAVGPHEHGWAGPGFTKPGPECDDGYRAGCAPEDAAARAGVVTIFDGSAACLTGPRHAPSVSGRQTGADGRTFHDRQHQ